MHKIFTKSRLLVLLWLNAFISPVNAQMFALSKANGTSQKAPYEFFDVKTNNAIPATGFEKLIDVVVSGKVTSQNGEGLAGVTVILKGTTTGTATGADGSFSLSIPGYKGTLQFSFVGFLTKEVPVPSSGNIQVIMEEDSRSLQDVVVVGYSTQKKVSMTSAVSQIKGEELMRRPVSSVQQALQGQLPGVTIIDRGGGPGKSNAFIRVRGITTIGSNNNPLVMVDGVEQRLSDINPDDIESISVLKDASSTAIYGSRAANGVVLITTRRAKEGSVSVNYNGFLARQQAINNPQQMGTEDYMRLQNVAYRNVGLPLRFTEQQIQDYLTTTDRLKYPLPNTWFETVYSPAPQMNHSLSVAGGSNTFKARLSLRYQDQDGILANYNAKTSEIRVNTDFKVSPKINVSTDVNYRLVNGVTPVNENIVYDRMLHGSMWTTPKFPDGTYGLSNQGHNPLLYAEAAGTAKTIDDYIVGNIKGDWEIVKGLKFTTQFASRINLTTGKNFTNAYDVRDYYQPEIIRRTVPLSSLNESRNSSREYTLNNILNYATTFGKHDINILGGYSEIKNTGSSLGAFRQGFYSNDIQSISQGANDNTRNNSGGDSTWGLRSYFSRLNYTFADKYLFEANARYDGSSRFLPETRYSFFPSFSAGWRISQEDFWGSLGDAINEFKLRGSWGKTGNQAVNLYSYYGTLNLVNYTFSGVPTPGYVEQRLTNQNITWETTIQSNIGIDAQFLNNRITFTADYYNKRTEGILLLLPIPATIGLRPSAQNAGIVDNKGWEFLLGARSKIGALGYEGSINFSINQNNVANLAGTGPYISGSDIDPRYIIGEGYAINSHWGYKTDGLFQTVEEIQKYPTLQAGTKPGDVKFVDMNKDGKINADDMTYLGTSFPKYTFGSSHNFSFNGFTLNLLFQGAAEVQTRLSGALAEMGNQEGFTHKIYADNYWTPERTDARFPRPAKFDLRNVSTSDRMLINGSYFRLKNVQLLYQIPAEIARKAYLRRASVYVAGTNLLTFSKLNEWNLDPEADSGRAQYYPQTALYTMGINLQF